MQRGVSGQREATRDAILRCATGRFARDGLEGTTLLDIATAAGLSKGAVTHHFSSKDDLLDAVVLRCAESLAGSLLPPLGEGATRTLRSLADAVSHAWSDDRDEARVLLLVSAAALHDPRLRSVSDGAWAALAAMLSDALQAASPGLRPRVAPEHLARWLLGAAMGQRLVRGEAPGAEAGEALRMALYACFEL